MSTTELIKGSAKIAGGLTGVALMGATLIPVAAQTAAAAPATPTATHVSTVDRQATSAVVAKGPGWIEVGSGKRTSITYSEGRPVTAAGTTALPAGASVNCGWTSCTVYVNRGSVHWVDGKVGRYANASMAVIAGLFATACAPIGGVGAVVCGAVGAVYGGYAVDQFNYASAHNECIAIGASLFNGMVPNSIQPYNGSHCAN